MTNPLNISIAKQPAHTVAYIGLGSNLEDPIEQVSFALVELGQIAETTLIGNSSLYASAPIGPADQPDYINSVAKISTQLNAHQLLDALQAIEKSHNRTRNIRWGARTLDLDLLLFGEEIIATDRLTVPHLEMPNRNFVIYPLLEIDHSLLLPSGKALSSLTSACPTGSLRKLDN
jgi:2-amino-4-hydroxy-6-hydroxymethyldihydropteridine diphosphokinase